MNCDSTLEIDYYAAMFFVDFFKSLRRRFRGEPSKPAPDPDKNLARPLAEATKTAFVERSDFTSFLLPLAGDDRICLYVLSLADIAAAGGDKWRQIGDLIAAAIKGIVDARVDPAKDRFTFLDPDTLCVVLPAETAKSGRSCAERIADALTGQLVGTQGIGGQHPRVTVSQRPLAALAGPKKAERQNAAALPAPSAPQESGLRPSWLDEQLAGRRRWNGIMEVLHLGRRRTADGTSEQPDWLKEQGNRRRFAGMMAVMHLGRRPPAPDETAPAWLQEQTGGRGGFSGLMRVLHLGTREETAKAAGWENDQTSRRRFRRLLRLLSLGQAFQEPASVLTPSLPPPRQAVQRPPAQIPPPTAPAREQADAGQGGNLVISELMDENGMALVWTPTLVSNRDTIGVFQACVARAGKDGKNCLEGAAAYVGLTATEALELDRFAAGHTAHELRALYLGRQRITLTVPVHWTSLAPRWQDAIPALFEQCPAKARQGFLKIEVCGLQANMPESVLKKLFVPLEPLGSDIMARLPLTATSLIPMLRHVQAVGVDLAELEDAQSLSEKDLFALLRTFSLTARKAKISCYVWGLRQNSLIPTLQAMGFSLINGPAVMGPVLHPEVTD